MISSSSLLKIFMIFTRNENKTQNIFFSSSSNSNLISVLIISQLSMTNSYGIEHPLADLETFDDFQDQFPMDNRQQQHEEFRRASLRYHPHVLYKKASLKPILGHNGKLAYTQRDRYRRSPLF